MDDMRTAVDVDTGEIFYAPKVKPKVKAGWCRMFQIKLEEIAKDRDLRGMPISVYLFMISKVDYDNICRFPQILIADELGTTAQYVSKSIRLLREKKIITEIKQRGTLVKAYSFNSKYIVKGKQDKKAAIVDETGEVIVEAEEVEADQAFEKNNSRLKAKSTRSTPLQASEYVDFDRFWSLYPKKTGKKDCQKIWSNLKIKLSAFEKIEAHLISAYRDTDKQFVPNPSTYLRGERWNDEIIKATPAPGKPQAPRSQYGEFTQ